MATWQHLRSSTANKRPTTSLADGRIAINTNTASPGLFFKDSAGTGIVKVGPVHVGTTAPNSVPASGGSSGNYTGEQWLDTSVSPAQMKVWNGSTWVGIVADELPVSKLQDGAARQLIQTDAAGTGVEWTSNVDVPGTLDVTSTATFDSIAQHPLGTAGAPTVTFTGDTNTGIYSPGADQVAISTNGTQRINIEADGDINIDSGGVFYDATNNRLAIGTTSPATTLDVNGDVTITDKIIHGGDTNTAIRFPAADTVSVETAGSERARIDSSGRLLVGTSSSVGATGEALQVIGTSQATSTVQIRGIGTTMTPSVNIYRSRGTSGTPTVVGNGDGLGAVNFIGYDGSSDIGGASILSQVDGTPGANDMPGRLVFSTTADGASSPTERMRIKSNGDICVNGTSSPSGAPRSNFYVSGDNGQGPMIVVQDVRAGTTPGYALIQFFRGTTSIGSITNDGVSVSYNTTSDYRLKENVVLLTSAVDRLNQLQVHRFNFIADPSKTVDGFIAHEAQAVVPECVTGEKDAVDDDGNPVYQGIDQSKLVPLLTAALQEAIGRIETLEAEVAALKSA